MKSGFIFSVLMAGFYFLVMTSCVGVQHDTVHIDGLTIHVVGQPSQIPYKGCQNWITEGCAVWPPASKGYEIWLVCSKSDKYSCGYWLMGHELTHILHAKRPDLFNSPDVDK